MMEKSKPKSKPILIDTNILYHLNDYDSKYKNWIPSQYFHTFFIKQSNNDFIIIKEVLSEFLKEPLNKLLKPGVVGRSCYSNTKEVGLKEYHRNRLIDQKFYEVALINNSSTNSTNYINTTISDIYGKITPTLEFMSNNFASIKKYQASNTQLRPFIKNLFIHESDICSFFTIPNKNL